jgi:hypothetical protein
MAWAEPWTFPFDSFPYRFNLECLADFQLGSRSTCLWKIEQHIDDILENAKTTDSGIIFAGDIEDEDRPSTRALRQQMAADRPEVPERDAQKHMAWIDRDVIPLLLKLHTGTKYGIMGGVAGHHWTKLSPALNSVQYIFNELKRKTGKQCVYLGEMVSFLDFRFSYSKKSSSASSCKSIRQVGLLQHGEGGGQTKASTINKLDRAAQGFEADFYIRGHDCQLVGTKNDQLFAKETHAGGAPAIHSRTKAMLNLGAATMGYEMGKQGSSYIETAMMRPATMGWGTLKFRIRHSRKGEDANYGLRSDIKLEF